MSKNYDSTWGEVRETVATRLRQAATSTKYGIIVLALVLTSLIPAVTFSGTVHADTDCSPDGIEYYGSSWLGGGGVNVCNQDGGSLNSCVPVTGAPGDSHCSSGNVWAGTKWQCVELVNRLYLTKGWTNATWFGNGNTLIYGEDGSGVKHGLPAGLTEQDNGTESYMNPGDVITLNNISDPNGHAAVVNSIDANGTVHIINQNTAPSNLNSSAYIDTGSFSNGNAHYTMNAWAGYTIQAFVHAPQAQGNTNNTVLEVKKLTQSDGTNEVVWAKATDVNESWWNSTSGGVQLGNLIHISQGDIVGFDVALYSSGEHDLFTATAHNIWETWWYPGQGLHTTEILPNIGNIHKIIKSVGPDGVTQQLYVMTDTGVKEYWWNSTSNGIQNDPIMTLANPVDEYKALEPDGTQALYLTDQNYAYEQHWGPGISGIQQTTFAQVSGTTSISFSEDSDGKHRLYIGSSSGAIWEASWYNGGSIGYWYMTGGAPVVQLQKWEDDSEQVLYEATAGGVFEYYWPTTSNTLSHDTIVGSLSNVHSFVRSTDPGGVQSVYTATGTNIKESWWIPGGNGITTGQIE